MPPLNVLFILSDQHNAKCLGHKGHPDVKTPNLDKLAAEGVRFENAITQNPICTPSRMCYISGQYAHNHGYYALSGANPGGLPTVFGHFRRHGYRTGAIGKIHCPEYWVEDDCDWFHETSGCSIGGRSAAYRQFLEERGKEELEDHEGFRELGKRGRQCCDARPSMVTLEESQEGWIAAQSIGWMQQCHAEGKPFFLHASLPKPHQTYAPAKEFWDLYDPEKLTLPPNADYEMKHKAPHLKGAAEHWRKGEWTRFEPHGFEEGRKRKLRGYLGNISQVDHAVGQMAKWLDTSGLAENTIIVYSADHGDYACEHGIMEKAPGICHDAITRIPYIWRLPKTFPAGTVREEIVETVDVTQTACALCGLPAMETSDGKDISHLLQGQSGAVREIGVTEFAWSKSIRKGDFRYVYYPREMFAADYPDGFGELYNLADDPWEMTNLFFEPDWQEKVREMKIDLFDWLVTTTRPATVLVAQAPESDQTIERYKRVINRDGKIHPDNLRQIRSTNYL